MASKQILPKDDLKILMNAHVGDYVGTRFGEAHVTNKMKARAAFAYRHFDDND